MYLEGYKLGYLNNREANVLEGITIKYYSIPDLYNMKYLFHFDIQEKEIYKYKSSIYDKLQKKKKMIIIFMILLITMLPML